MERFWDKINKTSTCWNWEGGLRAGYGAFRFKGKLYSAHRFSWYLKYNKFPKKWILHKCNNKICVRLSHLYEGTPKQNYADMKKVGNQYKPVKIYNSITEQKRASWKRWYERVKNEPDQIRYNRWRNSQKAQVVS